MVTLVRITIICIACVAAFALSDDVSAKDLLGGAIQGNSETTAGTGTETGSGNLAGNLTGSTQGNDQQNEEAVSPEPPAETSPAVLSVPDSQTTTSTTPSTTETTEVPAPPIVAETQPLTQVFTGATEQTEPSLGETAGLSKPADNVTQPQNILGQAPAPVPSESATVEQTPAPVVTNVIESTAATLAEPSGPASAESGTSSVLSVVPSVAVEPAPASLSTQSSAPSTSGQVATSTQPSSDPVAGFLGVELMTTSTLLESGSDTATATAETSSVLARFNEQATSSNGSRAESVLILQDEHETSQRSLLNAKDSESGLLAQWAATGSSEEPQSVLSALVPRQNGERQPAMAGLPNLPGSGAVSQTTDHIGADSQLGASYAAVAASDGLAMFESVAAPILIPAGLSPGPTTDVILGQVLSPDLSLGEAFEAIIQGLEPDDVAPESIAPGMPSADHGPPGVAAFPDSIIDDGMRVETGSQQSAPAGAVNAAPPVSSLLPATGGGTSTSSSVSADGAGSQVALLALMLMALITAAQMLRSESVRMPQGIHVSVPTPPG